MSQSTNGTVNAVTDVFTDASGERICYVGGEFSEVDGMPANNIAKWNVSTATWSTLALTDSIENGVNGIVRALAVDPNTGFLYVGGFFTEASGITADCISKWNPSTNTWSALGAGMSGADDGVNALAYDSVANKLYAGGLFANAGSVTGANNIACWNVGTSTWTALGTGMNDEVNALAYDSNSNILYAAGFFTTADGDTANSIASWNGTWNALSTGMDGVVNALTYDPNANTLYAGGYFTSAGVDAGGTPIAANSVAKWDVLSGTWNALGGGIYYEEVHALAYDSINSILYAGGKFTAADFISAKNIAQWNELTATWSKLGTGMNKTAYAFAFDYREDLTEPLTIDLPAWPVLYAGGSFTTAGGKASKHLAKYSTDGSTAPSAPSSVTANISSESAVVSYNAPASNGGREILSYTATAHPAGVTKTVLVTPEAPTPSIVLEGLTNGKAYTFKVEATNAVGTGIESVSSKSATPGTVPDAPMIGTATATIAGQASITFTYPKNNGGSAISSYTATSSPSGITATRKASQVASKDGRGPIITVYGLTQLTNYNFTVKATNVHGDSLPSVPSNWVTTKAAAKPGAPTAVNAVRGNEMATVSFLPPINNGGSPILTYRATARPGGLWQESSGKPITVTGLTNGTAYTFKVTATNTVGTGAASAASNRVTPAAVPGIPDFSKAVAGVGKVTLTLSAANNGSAVILYTVNAYQPGTTTPSGISATSKTGTVTVKGLTGGESYQFKAQATNAVGTGPESPLYPAGGVVVPTSVPDAPTIGTATANPDGEATITYTAPIHYGGSEIKSFTATSDPGNKTGTVKTSTSGEITVKGLKASTNYTFTVTAKNSVGLSAPSAASNVIKAQ
jgi:hypothetical protein